MRKRSPPYFSYLHSIDFSQDCPFAWFSLIEVDLQSAQKTAHLYRLHLPQKKIVRYTYGESLNLLPKLSPCQEWICFVSKRCSSPFALYLMPCFGGEARLLFSLSPQKSLVHAPFWLDSGNHLLFPLKTPEGYSLLLWDIWLDHARGRTPYSPYFQGFCHTDSPKIRGEEQIYFLQQTEKESLLCVAFLKKLEEVQTLYSFPGTICATWSAPPFLHLLLKKDSFTFSLSTWNYSEKKLAFPPVIATLLPSSPNESSPSFFSSLFPFGKENTLCSAWPCSDGYWSLSEWDYVQQRHTLFPSSLCLGVRGKKNQYFKYQQDSSSLQLSLIRWKETETQQISEESIFETSFPNRDLEPSRTSLPYSASSFSRTYFQELKIFSTPLALRDSSTYGF